jgi:hypothetical protein
MNYLLLALAIGVLAWLAAKWMEYRKTVRSTDGYAKRRIFAMLFLAFMPDKTSIFNAAFSNLLPLHYISNNCQ